MERGRSCIRIGRTRIRELESIRKGGQAYALQFPWPARTRGYPRLTFQVSASSVRSDGRAQSCSSLAGPTSLSALGAEAWWAPVIPAVIVVLFFRWLEKRVRPANRLWNNSFRHSEHFEFGPIQRIAESTFDFRVPRQRNGTNLLTKRGLRDNMNVIEIDHRGSRQPFSFSNRNLLRNIPDR